MQLDSSLSTCFQKKKKISFFHQKKKSVLGSAHRSDHQRVTRPTGACASVSPPYIDSDLNFRGLYLGNRLTNPCHIWTQALSDRPSSIHKKKSRKSNLIPFPLGGVGDEKMGYYLTPPYLRQIRRGKVHHAYHK